MCAYLVKKRYIDADNILSIYSIMKVQGINSGESAIVYI